MPPGRRRTTGFGSTFASLAERDFAWYLAGNIAFFMGMQMQLVLRGFLAFEISGAAAALGLISASIALPMLLISPFGGVVADRVDKKQLLMISQSAAAVFSLVLALLIITDLIEFWHLLVASVGTGVVFAFNMPARQALVPQLVPQHKIMNAISLQMGANNLTRIVAPALGGVLIAPMGVGWVYIITVGLFIIAVASEVRLPSHGMISLKKESKAFREDLVEGIRYVRNNNTIMLLLSVGLFMPLFAFPVQMLLPVFAENVFDRGASGLGILAGTAGVGGLIGALIAANLERQPAKGRIMLAGAVIMGAFMFAFATANIFALALVFLIATNIGQMIFMTTNNTVIQTRVPEQFRGRVMSIMMMSFGLMPLGVLPTSIMSDIVGVGSTVQGSATILLLALLAVFLISKPLRNLRLEVSRRALLSPVQAATLVATGELTQEEADRMVAGLSADEEVVSDEDSGPGPGPIPAPAPAVSAPAAVAAITVADSDQAIAVEQPRSGATPVGRIFRRSWRPAALGSTLAMVMVLGFVASRSGEIWRSVRARFGGSQKHSDS